MRRITRKIWSHNSLSSGITYILKDVRRSEPTVINTFPELVESIAKVYYNNKHLNLFYRGQNAEHMNANEETMIMPSIYRGLGSRDEQDEIISGRKTLLKQADEFLRNKIGKKGVDLDATFMKYKEVRWAIFQHYEVCKTPLLDVTSSLRAACSFAFHNDSDTGYLYVLGLPHINGSISYYVDESLLNIKLLSICPPHALRPHYQEGYLVGSFPMEIEEDIDILDFGRRLIAKFKIIKSTFWNEHFREIPVEALYPTGDRFKELSNDIKIKLAV